MITFGQESQWRYDPTKPLGAPGGFGSVFLGQGSDGVGVAVKVVPASGEVDRDQLRRREVEIMHQINRLGSPRLIRMLDVADGEDNELLIVLELADGQLHIDSRGVPIEVALAMLEQIVAALVDLHAAGIIHRDLKPANILRTAHGLVLSDFGIARDAEIGTRTLTFKGAGTPAYMAPEMWRVDGPVTNAVDLYAIGVIAHELLTGSRPFFGGATELEAAHASQPPPALPDHIPAKMRSIVTRLLARDRHARYPDARAVLEQLAKVRTTFAPTEASLAEAIAGFDRQDAEVEAAKQLAESNRREALGLFKQARADMAEIVEDAMGRLEDIDPRFTLIRPMPEEQHRFTSEDWSGEKHRWTINGPHVQLTIRLWQPPHDADSTSAIAGEVILGEDRQRAPFRNIVHEDDGHGNRWQLYGFLPNQMAGNRRLGVPSGDQWQGLDEESLRALWRERQERAYAPQWMSRDPERFDESTIITMLVAATRTPSENPNPRSNTW